MIQTVAKYTLRQPPMLFRLERLLLAQPLADDVRQTKRQRQQGDQFLQTLRLNHMRLFKPKAATLQTAKQRFDFPALRIIANRLLGLLRCDHNQILATGQPHPRYKQLQPPDQSGFLKAQGLIDGLPSKQSPCRHHLSASIGYFCILANTDTEVDVVSHQPLEPNFADKLTVCAQIQDRTGTKQGDKLSYNGLALSRVGIAFLLQDRPQHRDGDALINNAQHQNVQRRFAEM